MISICAAAFAGGAFAFGVDVRAALTHRTQSTCLPLNAKLFKMRQPDGVERIFFRSWENPNVLTCTKPPWVGVIRPERRMINICTDLSFKGGKTEFCFIDGVLRFMSVGSKSYDFPPRADAVATNGVELTWVKEDLTEDERQMADLWRKDSRRLRWFSRNPNRSALIFVEFALLTLALGLFARLWIVRGPSLLLALVSVVLALKTFSRGGFLALVTGMGILLFFRFRKGFGKKTLAALLFVSLAVAGALVATKSASRLTVGVVKTERDKSAQSRLVAWREVPRMLAAAPLGWGLWQSGPAYNSWFEKPENMHMMGDLFNDHLSRLVEGGFVGGGLYVFLWALVFVWSLRLARTGGTPVPLAVSAAYFVASTFNPMNHWMPGFSLLAVALVWGAVDGWRRRSAGGQKGVAQVFAVSAAVTLLVLSGAAAVAALAPAQDVPLRVGWMGRSVVVGEGEPRTWVVDDGYVLCGDFYGFPGKELRDYYRENPHAEALGLVNDPKDLPPAVDRLVVTGTWCKEYLARADSFAARHVVLLSPTFGSDRVPPSLREKVDLHVLTGHEVARLTGDVRRQSDWVHVVPGAEAYVPGWLDVVVRKNK